MEENKKMNEGVCCDVTDCIHNIDGCNCTASTIKVTGGKTDSEHFCRTYECENGECEE